MARVGQKGRLCRRWWTRGRRPPGRRDQRLQGAYIFAAVEPATGADVALVLPQANAVAMSLFLAELAAGCRRTSKRRWPSMAPAGMLPEPWPCGRTSPSFRCRPTGPS
jgi:hypothetical protein